MLSVENLEVAYGDVRALDDVSLGVAEGAIVAIVGANGAGKTTLVRCICGLLPVLGNLISNTIIVGISFTISPKMALAALIFLVVIHKFEYFLNSKIIGDRIKNPVWLTLLGLILGEKLMGVPGMILAPIILNYLKVEASKIEVGGQPPESSPPTPPTA